jgi:DeoR/GlpR family transcriptional regulator of sugar metabolism
MLAQERRFRIREMLEAQRTVTAAELTRTLGVTPATIRRDLAALEAEGILVRSHGGAVSRTSSTSYQPAYQSLLRTNELEKQTIARAAEPLILEGDTVFLEGSTTVYELAKLLRGRQRLTVVTNSPPIVSVFQHSAGVSVISTGGDLQKDQMYLSGVWTSRAIDEIRVDKAVIGVTALDLAYGMSAATHAEAAVKKGLLKAARQSIALADHSKFGHQCFAFVAPITDVHLMVTDSGIDSTVAAELKKLGIQLIVAERKGSSKKAAKHIAG